MNSVIRLQQRHGNGLACHRARFGLHRVAAVNNSVCGLATMPWRVTCTPFAFRARAKAEDTVRFAAAGMRLSFSEAFHAPLPWCSERCQGEKWRTKYNHSGDITLSRGLGMSGSESETFIDPVYLGLGVNLFHIDHGTLSLLAEPTSKRIMSTVEARIKISNVPGTWPERLGDEIDVMETLGGRPTRQHKSDHRRVDRQKRDQSKTLDKVDLSADFATYGLLWMADTIAHYPDSVEIGRFPNVGLHSPMYLIVSMDMDGDWNKTGGQRPTKRTCEYGGSI